MKKSQNVPGQVSLAGAAMGGNTAKRHKKKKSARFPRRLVWVIIIVVVLAIVGWLIVKPFLHRGPSLTAREMVEYTYTPDDICEKVSYYLLGITADDPTARMEMVAVLCVDRKKDTTSLLQIPVATSLGKDTGFDAAVIGDIWGHPKAALWCPTCRCRVAAEDAQDNKHVKCGTALEKRTGSSYTNLIEAINKQYGLPIDNYLVVPRAGLATLIDAVGGVDVALSAKMSYNAIDYEKGTRTLSGEAAVYYITQYNYNGTPASDRDRMMRQRQVLAALVSRLSRYKVAEMYNTDPAKMDVFSNVMLGRNPIRMDTTSFGKARLMGSAHDGSADNVKFIRALAEFTHELCKIPLTDMTCSILPGTAIKDGANTVYAVNKSQTVALLNEQMNPRGLTLDEETIGVEQIGKNPAKADLAIATLDTVAVEQTEPTTATTTTTATEE